MKHKKPHTIELSELQEFVQKEYVTFASSSRENKKLIITLLKNEYAVLVGSKIMYHGSQASDAVEAYNAITEKYIDPVKTFRI